MTTWTQNYEPLGSVLSPLIAAIPVVLLLALLASGRVRAHWAALAGLVSAILAAVIIFVPQEVGNSQSWGSWLTTVLSATGYGAAFGLLPIGWIVFAAIFLYTMTVETGQFEIVKRSVVSLSDDRRIQALLIAFSFGAFVEGAAGFGTPVAISAALMMGAGFKPLYAAGLALLANTAPVAFGALGTPILTLAEVATVPGMSEEQKVHALSAMAGRQLPLFSVIVPTWLVWVMAGWRGVIGVWPALVVCGGSFAGVQFLISNYHGPWLVDVVGGLVSLIALALFLRVWQPKESWHFPDEEPEQESEPLEEKDTPRQIFYAWMPWILLTVFVFVWGIPEVKRVLGKTSIPIEVEPLHEQITRTTQVVRTPEPEKAIYNFDWLKATGTGIFLSALLSAIWLRLSIKQVWNYFNLTLYRLRWPLFTIACMLAIAFTTRYVGMDATLGLAFTRTGFIYPMFAALLGWLGVALTGSDTSSNALFGSLQTITANRLVADGVLPLSEVKASILMASANSTGGVMGKMIDAQSIVVSAAATQQSGGEGAILRFVFWHSLILALLMGGLVMFQAYVWQSVIPG